MSDKETTLPNYVSAEHIVVLNNIDLKLAALDKKVTDLEVRVERGEPVSFVDGDVRTVSFTQGNLHFRGKKGVLMPITWGELRTAAHFGFEFQFGEQYESPEVTGAPQYIASKRAFVISEYQRRKQHLEHMRQAFLESINPLNRRNTDVAYEAWFEDIQKDDVELSPGKLAEKLFSAYLIRLAQDEKMYVAVYDPGPIEDIDYKVDIMIQGRFTDGQLFHIGVQFTTDDSSAAVAHKDKLADRGIFKRNHEGAVPLDWYHLIASGGVADALIRAFTKWRPRRNDGTVTPIQKCDPRGPLQFLDDNAREELHEITAPLLADIQHFSEIDQNEYQKEVEQLSNLQNN